MRKFSWIAQKQEKEHNDVVNNIIIKEDQEIATESNIVQTQDENQKEANLIINNEKLDNNTNVEIETEENVNQDAHDSP